MRTCTQAPPITVKEEEYKNKRFEEQETQPICIIIIIDDSRYTMGCCS